VTQSFTPRVLQCRLLLLLLLLLCHDHSSNFRVYFELPEFFEQDVTHHKLNFKPSGLSSSRKIKLSSFFDP
jgi:hypothetical protein